MPGAARFLRDLWLDLPAGSFALSAQAGLAGVAALMLLVSLCGAAVASRQVFLQAFAPEDMAACLANLQYLLDTQPYLKVLSLVLYGHAGCSEISWSFVGLSIPEWSLLAFAGLSVFALGHLFVRSHRMESMESGRED